MSAQLIVRSEADAEMMDAAEWYEKRREGLGREFLEEVERGLIDIQLHPRQFPVIHRDVRRLLIHRFPYGIYYVATEETISIIAVYHGSRDPNSMDGSIEILNALRYAACGGVYNFTQFRFALFASYNA